MFSCGLACGPTNPLNSDVNYHLNLCTIDGWIYGLWIDELIYIYILNHVFRYLFHTPQAEVGRKV